MIHLSNHARKRCQQRGITTERLAALFDNADVDCPIGSNCRLVRVTRRTARRIHGGDRLANLSVIVSDNTGQVVTVLHLSHTRRGRRYRRAA
jgi:hypothetical protein